MGLSTTQYYARRLGISSTLPLVPSLALGTADVSLIDLTTAYGVFANNGALVSPLKSVSPDMGTGYVIDAFMVVVLGGVQSLAGTVASAFILGELSGGIAFLQNDTVAKAIVLLAIVVLIRFRPEGLFTARVRA